MSDPFDALRAGYRPVVPDAAFAARLRAELELAVLGRSGANMSTESHAAVVVDATAPADGDVVYSSLCVPDVARGERFYAPVLGWRVVIEGDPRLRRRVVGVAPEMTLWGGAEYRTLFLCHAVTDVTVAADRIRELGGTAAEPEDRPFGRLVDCVDDQGMGFAILQAPPVARRRSPGPGELLYLTVEVPDSARFRAFYGGLFGWTFTPGRVEDGWNVGGVTPMMGMRGGAEVPTVVPMYGVADITAAVVAVRSHGGTSTEPERQPYGTTAECVDDQGLAFYLGQV